MANDPGDPLGASCYATSCILFHRYLHRVPLTETDVWSAAMASALLASKLHETVRVVPPTIVQTFYELYRERVKIAGCASNEDLRKRLAAHPSVSCVSSLATGNEDNGENAIPRSGPTYQEWIKAVIEAESDLLRQLGFVVHWIPDHLAHKYLPHFLDVIWDSSDLKVNKDEVAQRSWNYCNDSYRLDLSSRFHPSVVTCAAIHLSLLDAFGSSDEECTTSGSDQSLNVGSKVVGGWQPNEVWWKQLARTDRAGDVSLVCNALLGLRECFEVKVAEFAFVSSVSGRAFNDPCSRSWDHVGGNIQKEDNHR